MSGAFPSPGDEIYTNEAGEVMGWSKPAEPEWCYIGGHYTITGCNGECMDGPDDDDDYDYQEDSYDSDTEGVAPPRMIKGNEFNPE